MGTKATKLRRIYRVVWVKFNGTTDSIDYDNGEYSKDHAREWFYTVSGFSPRPVFVGMLQGWVMFNGSRTYTRNWRLLKADTEAHPYTHEAPLGE